MRSNSTSIRGNALEGIMRLAGSKTGERASAASQGCCDKPTEKDIPVVWAFGIDFTGQGGRHAVFEKFLIRHLRSSGYAYIYRCNENLTSQMCPQCKQRIPDKNRTNLRRYECILQASTHCTKSRVSSRDQYHIQPLPATSTESDPPHRPNGPQPCWWRMPMCERRPRSLLTLVHWHDSQTKALHQHNEATFQNGWQREQLAAADARGRLRPPGHWHD
ncbi:hypothetical protein BC831DRAFT_121329 [Entophlyctis helioformis]|nr:hypothetical protein BC831DRAFT_121329 [Entophlyctis helioformis]